MGSETFDTQNVIDQEEILRPKMVTVEIAGKTFQVPEGITVIKALWYTGQDVVRGVGHFGAHAGDECARRRDRGSWRGAGDEARV